jgi:uroporphyrinogen III methyltransferase / synthase
VTVHLVGAGPGDPGLITVRGADLLARADVIVHDRLVLAELLELARKDALLIDVGKLPGTPRSQDAISELLIELSQSHEIVVRLKGGDPFVFGRGGEEVEALTRSGIGVEVVPGVTSAFAAPAFGGVPVTQRGISSSVTVVTGHVGDTDSAGSVDWRSLGRAGGTLVILMGVATRGEIARRLMEAGRSRSTPVCAVVRGTTPLQKVLRTTLGELGATEIDSPATIVVGPVAGLGLDWLSSQILSGWTVAITRPAESSELLASMLRDRGASVVNLPAIAITEPADGAAALSEALGRVGEYDWVALTSANAAASVLQEIGDLRRLAGVRVAVVGPATAEALRAGHLVADLVAQRSSASGLVEALGVPTGGGRVLFCRAAEALATLPDGLRSAGWSVDEVEAYRTVVAGPGDGATPGAIDRAAKADAAVFASPSAVRGFISLLAGRRLPRFAVCIGPTTASEADAVGFEEITVAGEANEAGLLGAVLEAKSEAERLTGPGPGPRGSGVGSRR